MGLAAGSAALFVAAAALAASPTPAPPAYASAAANVDSIVDKVIDHDPGLRSYSAVAHLDLRQVSFPYLHPVLDGHAYVSAPGYTTFDYPHTPFYLKGITKVQGAFADASRWLRCYDITVASKSDGYALHMVPKVQGEIAYVDVLLGLEGTIDRAEWRYRENMKDYIALTQTYTTIDGHSVVTSQASDVALHHIRAKGTQTFSNFEFNVPVPTPSPTPSDPAHACDN